MSMNDRIYQNPYLLMTPGPLTTTQSVRRAMTRDWCTWDDDYKAVTQRIRAHLLTLGECSPERYSSVLIQGSGTYVVESVLTSTVGEAHKVLILANGAYGRRMGRIAEMARLNFVLQDYGEVAAVDPADVARRLDADPAVTHVALVHCETTTGLLNPLASIVREVKRRGRCVLVDAMSSFGGIPLAVEDLDIDCLISSPNKCIQGVPGFGLVIAKQQLLLNCEGRARSLSLDLFDQWRVMEEENGKWRFTSPTHAVHAFLQAIEELADEGGIGARHARYVENQRRLAAGMASLGFPTLLPPDLQSPVITSFIYPQDPMFSFDRFYQWLKARGYVIYPGNSTEIKTFRIGTIGDIRPNDIDRFIRTLAHTAGRP